ncbi:MAG: hypothetical protein WCA49_08325 [Candidatus Sulfotelmatobacter sp.]
MGITEFQALVQPTADSPQISVRVAASAEISSLPHDQAEARLSELLNQVRFAPEFTLYGFWTRASYVEPPVRSALHGHNTRVEVSLPYTLHLPSNMTFELVHPQIGRATIISRKVWTTLAKGSNEAEIYAEDQLLYYGPAQPLSPYIPQAPELGPWPHFTGTNVEIAKDTHGIFRYTLVRVLFDTVPIATGESRTAEELEASKSQAFSEAKNRARDIVNHLLDVYSYVTGAEHIERLPTMTITSVYFADGNLVSDGVSVENGIGSAIVNRSGHEIRRIKEMLLSGAEPERHVLLLQSSHAALNRGQVVVAVVVAFQALEILLESKIRTGYSKLGVSDTEITSKLKDKYKTKDRLTVLCREITGGRSVADDSAFWISWLTDCNRKRNGIVHRNETMTLLEARRLVELCEQCIARLSTLPFPV